MPPLTIFNTFLIFETMTYTLRHGVVCDDLHEPPLIRQCVSASEQEASQIPARFRRFFTSQIRRNLKNLAKNLALLLSEVIFHKGKLRFARFCPSDLRGIPGI